LVAAEKVNQTRPAHFALIVRSLFKKKKRTHTT